ncbi:MAG: glycoside hydrolase family 108 protein [Rhodobiaceae bacterium]|nr:glycoside hydrolase family 108 protein [Rhodobiaceae bacterium]
MQRNFLAGLAFTLKFEGGYVNHPKDPGRATNKGITIGTYRGYHPKATVADLKAITDAEVSAIYRRGYWDKVNGDRLAAGVDVATFDYGVHSGPAAANKSLRKVVGGPDVQTVKRLCARRLSIYRGFSHWSTFGKGWTRRITALEAFAVRLAVEGELRLPSKVKTTLAKEEAAAKKTAKTQAGAATGTAATGAGTAGASGPAQDSLAQSVPDALVPWVLGAVVIGFLGVAAFLLWRAHVNRLRGEAYRKELQT